MSKSDGEAVSEAELEHHKFHRLYHIDFDEARHTLEVHRRYGRKDVRFCLLRAAVVVYARPFSKNRSVLHRKHVLTLKVVPIEMRPLHKELVDLRMGLFAHTDFSFRKPQLAKWPTTTGKAVFPLGFAHGNLDLLDRRAQGIRQLVRAVMQDLATEIPIIEERLSWWPSQGIRAGPSVTSTWLARHWSRPAAFGAHVGVATL